MLTRSQSSPNQALYGTAKLQRRHGENRATNLVVMSTVVCEQCGARFTISHRLFSEDANLAQRQAAWLADRFVWDHIQENKHPGSIHLPGGADLKPGNSAASHTHKQS